jgi:four helix bundle protein
MSESIVLEKAIKFALRIVKLYKYLTEEKKEYVLSKLVLLSGTHIAKHVKSALNASSRPGFNAEMFSGLNCASDTELWLMLLHYGDFLDEAKYKSINDDCIELIKLTASISKTTKNEQ